MIRRNAKRDTNARKTFRIAAVSAAVMSAFAASNAALAFEIPTGNDDLVMRWDNTVRYNLGMRVQAQDPVILNAVNNDDGDRNFSKNSIVTNRFDVLSEFDLVWKKSYGLRVSGAGWWDSAYNSLDNTSTQTSNTLENGLPVAGVLSPYSKRYAKGASGEWLDAFLFANVDVAGIPVNVKAGQHTVYWGDSLLLGGAIHGISYAQNSIDAWKGFATPGAEAKELFRPRGGLTIQAQPLQELSVAAQWFYNWQAIRYPESGTFLTVGDPFLFGGDSQIVAPNPLAAAVPGSPQYWRAWNTFTNPASRYSGSLGDYGVAARWSPQWLDGTLGFYYRNATDIQPQAIVTPGVAPLPAATCTAIGGQPVPGAPLCIINKNATSLADLTQKGKYGTYTAVYGDNIHMYGLTLSKEFGGVSVGAEVSYRQNMPLLSEAVPVLPAPLVSSTPGAIATTAVPANGTPGALGSTWHLVLNGLGLIGSTPLFDTAGWAVELTAMHVASVTQNEAVYVGRPGYNKFDKATRSYTGLAINFTPQWFQVLPGMDMFLPISWAQGLNGNAAVTSGGQNGAGNYAVGVAVDLYQKYRVDLKYTGYYGDYSTSAASPALGTVFNRTNAQLSDRGWISLTFKTTF